jgi:serine/threonine protein kinase
MQVDDLTLTKSLGKGAFGEVFLTQKKGSKEFYATKRLDRAFSEKPENIKLLSNEITLLKKINHPNIVRLIDLKKTKSHCYIVMEYCNGGDLSGCLKKYKEAYRRPFSEEIVQYIMRQVVNGINFLHSNKIVHRDLKLDNILVTFPSENDKKSLNMMKAIAKIIDFGFATRLKASKSNLTYTILGTPANMAPQILENMQQRTPNHQGYDEKVDIWSLGTLCYEMLVGHMAFCGHSMQELSQKVKQGTYSLPTNLSKEVISFIDSMLQTDPNKRSSARDLLKHDFLVKNVKQFQPIDVRKIQGMVSGGVINVNSNSNSGKTGNLTQTVWDIFNGPGIITQQPVRPAQQVGIPLQQPMPHMQVPHQQAYMVPSGIPPQQQFINPGYMPQMKMGYY